MALMTTMMKMITGGVNKFYLSKIKKEPAKPALDSYNAWCLLKVFHTK